nr:hypothetical protein [Tanacetum cinerariifolium]
MSPFVLCVGCGTALYGFSPCRWCTYERCGNDLLNGFCSLCNLRNSCVYDPKPNSFDCHPDSYHPSHLTYETYSGDSCGNDSHLGYDCPPQFPLNYEPEPAYIQNYTSYPHDSPSFPQQYLYCDNCGGPHETFQCQPMNQDFCNSNSSGFNQSQPPQFYSSLDRVFEIKNAFGNKQYKPEDLQELFRKLFNDVQNIHEELAEYIDTPGWNRPAFDDDDDDVDYTIAITPVLSIAEPVDSLSIEDEHLDTTPKTKPDEIIKSGVEELVPILNENEVTLEDKKEYIEYVEASLSDPETINVVEENVVYQEEEGIEPDQEKLINVVKNDIPDDSTNDPFLEEANLFLAFDNSIPQDVDFEPDYGDEISVVMKNSNKLECLNPRDEFDDDYFSSMFVIYFKMFLSFLFTESEDTIFDPGIAIYRFYSFKPGLSHRCGTFKKFNTHQSHMNESPMEMLFSTCFPSDQ